MFQVLATIANFIVSIELHLGATHWVTDTVRGRRPNWDYEIGRFQRFFDALQLIAAFHFMFRQL